MPIRLPMSNTTMTDQRHVVLGVTGGIAVYKSAALASAMVKENMDVHVVMTRHAAEFITPITFETLTKNPVVTELFDRSAPHEVAHIALAKLADLVVVAPATANCLAKMATGVADDFLSTMLLATRAQILLAPAMNTNMLHHPATQRNLRLLEERGCRFVYGGSGMLACGDVGDGRMAEPEDILGAANAFFAQKQDLHKLRVLVTAGPTRERIDEVRFLSNRSTGRMGYALAQRALERGAEVTLVSGKTALAPPEGAETLFVESAQQMYDAAMSRFDEADIVVAAAAVADYTPAHPFEGKLKKQGDFSLELVRTRDILLEMGMRKAGQVLVGFAAEAGSLRESAEEKLARKRLDFIAANDISREDVGFESENNEMHLYFADGRERELPFQSKLAVADAILDEAAAAHRAKKEK